MQTIIGKDIAIAQQYLVDGNIVAIPTETVYGLAANALNEDAVLKIFEVKIGRSLIRLLCIVAVGSRFNNMLKTSLKRQKF